MHATAPALRINRLLRRGSPRDRGDRGDRGDVRWPVTLPCIWHVPRPWLAVTGVLIAMACFCALVQGPTWQQSPVLAAVNLGASLAYVFTGLMLCREPGQRVTAMALGLAGLFRSVDFIDAWNGIWPAYTLVFGGVDRVFGAWALLRYPTASLSLVHRRYLLTLAGWMLCGRTLLLLVTPVTSWATHPSSDWWPAPFPSQQLSSMLNYVVHGGEGICGLALVALLVNRMMRARGVDRIVIAPITMAGIAAVLAAIVSAVMMTLSLSGTPNDAYLIEGVTDLAIPAAFLTAVVLRLLLIKNVTELTAQVTAGGDIDAVRRALRTALHDPTLDLVSSTGGQQMLDQAGPGRLVSYIHAGQDEPIAVVVADPVLARYRQLFDAATAASGLALRNAQLRAKAAQERLEQVKASRARIVEAELAERRRLERDLHDGVQQHLLGIAAGLSVARRGTADPAAAVAFDQAQNGLRTVLADLRDLAHGIHPALLTQSGLAAALQEVADRLPLPVRVRVPPGRLDPAVEATLYFVACEALANAVKHAQASRVLVTVRTTRTALEMEIKDDGAGGVPASASQGPGSHGLANMADRVGTLDGELVVDSPPGQGTRLVVTIPCG
jgi:signal transduction histidine kinase